MTERDHAVGPTEHGAAGEQPPTPVVNLPNALTLLRLLLVPLFLVFLFQDNGQHSVWRWTAAAVFAIAAITDRYDGQIARQRGLVTNFGKIADPIADKALTGGALIGLSILGDLPWWVTAVIMIREIGITMIRLALLSYAVLPAGAGGKLKTLVQIVAIGLYIMPLPASMEWFRISWMAAAVLLTVVTGVDYLVKSVRIVLAGKPAKSAGKPSTAKQA